MTLDAYTSFVCSKIGQNDDLSRQACAGYLQARYRMIWDALLWRDTRCLLSVTATAAAVALPAAVERVVSIRATVPGDSAFLDPADDLPLPDPRAGFPAEAGIPRYYEEFIDPDDSAQPRKLRIFPAPTATRPATLLIAGKRPFPGWTDGGSSPLLRNVDNALLTFAAGDMLERQRQYGKAQAKFNEAAAHLAAMVELETRQAGQIVQLIPA